MSTVNMINELVEETTCVESRVVELLQDPLSSWVEVIVGEIEYMDIQVTTQEGFSTRHVPFHVSFSG